VILTNTETMKQLFMCLSNSVSEKILTLTGWSCTMILIQDNLYITWFKSDQNQNNKFRAPEITYHLLILIFSYHVVACSCL
jgi:hypothetical protein